MSRACDALVVGGGLIGLWSALELRRAGLAVRVLEAATVGRHASSASAGGVRSLNRHPAEIPLARLALPLWRDAAASLDADVGFSASGQIRVAEDDEGMALLEERAALTRSLSYRHEKLIGANALRDREPALAPHIKGGLMVEDDGFADPLKAIHAVRRALAREGVVVEEGRPVLGVRRGGRLTAETTQGHLDADFVVNAAGAWGNEIARSVAEAVPMTARGLQMSVTEPVPLFVKAVLGSSGKKLSLKQTAAGHVVLGGGFFGQLDQSGTHARTLPAQVAKNLANAVSLFPELSRRRIMRSWAGIEGITDDGLPVLCESGTTPGLLHAFGFCGHGFALAPLIARLVAGIITGKTSPVPLEPFSASRFHRAVQEPVDA